MIDADYAFEQNLLSKIPAPAGFRPHCPKQVGRSIGLYVNVNKTGYMFQKGTISRPRGKTQKLVNQFTYLGSNISSTERDINIRLAKVGNTFDRLPII